MKIVFVLGVVLALFATAKADIWAVCVAGSNGYSNYRHQADTANCYQIFHMNGIPDDHIVTMLYDDVANSPSNPKPGKLYNWPDGPDVYTGMVKDYVGNDVTPQNFLKVIQGEATGAGSGKVLKSTAEDYVFITFYDHGAPGIIAFPNGQVLHAKDLVDALNNMASKNMFKQLVFYLEACESGSMFNNLLPADKNIYGLTASDPTESSWACYYDSTVRAYLTDCFSINWMLNVRNNDKGGYTLKQQYEAVKEQTTQSHVCQYGDLSYLDEEIATFFGKVQAARKPPTDNLGPTMAVPMADVKITTLERMMEQSSSLERKELYTQYRKELALRERAEKVFGKIVSSFGAKDIPESNDLCKGTGLDLDCMKEAINSYMEECFALDDYALSKFKYLANLCNANVDTTELRQVMRSVCHSL